jgi:DNA-binding response OmpR family regulator
MVGRSPAPYLAVVSDAISAERRLKVLIVEDSTEVRGRLVSLLREMPSLDVLWVAESVREAHEVLQTLRPDVALLDLRLPDGSGLDVLREIRASISAEAFIIMMTAFPAPHLSHACLSAGADLFLDKSGGFTELPAVLQVLAGGRLA